MKCNYNGCSSKCKGNIDVESCNVLRAYQQGKTDGRTDVLDELNNIIEFKYYDAGYGDYHEVEMIVRMIKALKENKNENIF